MGCDGFRVSACPCVLCVRVLGVRVSVWVRVCVCVCACVRGRGRVRALPVLVCQSTRHVMDRRGFVRHGFGWLDRGRARGAQISCCIELAPVRVTVKRPRVSHTCGQGWLQPIRSDQTRGRCCLLLLYIVTHNMSLRELS